MDPAHTSDFSFYICLLIILAEQIEITLLFICVRRRFKCFPPKKELICTGLLVIKALHANVIGVKHWCKFYKAALTLHCDLWALAVGLTCCFLMQRLTDDGAAQKLPPSGLNTETAQGDAPSLCLP